jgi:hypothetical protein
VQTKDILLETTNYKIFKNIKGNRPVLQRHIGRLIASIGQKNLLQQNPIIVNERYQIIDGQHRLEAAKRLGLPIWYVVVDSGDLADAQRVNSYVRNWKPQDFLNSYVALDNPVYLKFKELLQVYKVSVKTILVFIYGHSDADTYDKFREGSLVITAEEFEKAERLLQAVDSLRPYFIDHGYKSTIFHFALSRMDREGLVDNLIVKTQQSSPRYRRMATVKEWLRVFQDILNFKQKTNKVMLESLVN